ncbi:MAG: response regulator [Actinomycetota bacterium]
MTMAPTTWNILVVDDEPDVLSITRLALRDLIVRGLPLNVVTASSKADAIEILATDESIVANTAVGFIDVVMESDTAGLELCEHIRNERNDSNMQLFIRTGQPGTAPERDVIDRYDISGYFTKAEMTEDKLYSLVKAGVRQFDVNRIFQGTLLGMSAVMANAHSREAMKSMMMMVAEGFLSSDVADNAHYYVVGDEPFFGPIGISAEDGQARIDELEGLDGVPFGFGPDKIITADNGDRLISIGATEHRPKASALIRMSDYDLSHTNLVSMTAFMQCFATLWGPAGP